MSARPDYAIRPMSKLRKNGKGPTLISTFSGCGGSCLGFRWAGYRTLYASEFVDAAADTYEANHPGVPVDRRDIREVMPEEILEQAGVAAGAVDVLEGSPPCASFSMCGKREKRWGEVEKYSDTKQRTDDLFFEFARLLEGVKPRVFVAENVPGLTRGTASGYFAEIFARLEQCGYRVSAKILDAQWLGVPQRRQRLFMIGVRNDLDFAPPFPVPLSYSYSLRDALPWVSATETTPDEIFSDVDRSACRIDSQQTKPDQPYSIYDLWRKLKLGQNDKSRFNLFRPNPDDPCPTITQTGGNPGSAAVCHPYEPRKFAILEIKRLCGFPDDFKLTGDYLRQWERLGRAVPPPVSFAVAKAIKKELR